MFNILYNNFMAKFSHADKILLKKKQVNIKNKFMTISIIDIKFYMCIV